MAKLKTLKELFDVLQEASFVKDQQVKYGKTNYTYMKIDGMLRIINPIFKNSEFRHGFEYQIDNETTKELDSIKSTVLFNIRHVIYNNENEVVHASG